MLLLIFITIVLFLLKRYSNLRKIFVFTILLHLIMLVIIYLFLTPNAPNFILNDGDIYSVHGGIISLILRGIEFNREYIWEHFRWESYWGYFFEKESFYSGDFLKGKIPEPSIYGIGYISYIYSLIYAAYGYMPVSINILNILLNLITGLVIFKVCEVQFNQKSAYIAIVLFFLNPISLYYSTTKAKEALYVFAAYLSIYLAILSVQKKNIPYFLLIIPSIFLLKSLRLQFFLPTIIVLAIYFTLNLFSKKKLLFIITPMLGIILLIKYNLIYNKWLQAIETAMNSHKGYLSSGGNNYNLLIFGDNTALYNSLEKIIYIINAWYHLIFEPILLGNISFGLLAYYPFKIIFVFLCISGVLGAISSFRSNKNNFSENILLLSFLFIIGSMIALASGNIGTMLRHRDIITPIIFMYASYSISKLGNFALNALTFGQK